MARQLCFTSALFLLVAVYSCTTDEDCSLLGVCSGGVCQCSKGWRGEDCGTLDLLPAPVPPLNGYNVPNTSSWGAGVLADPGTGLYQMFVAEFVNHCGLQTWHNNSRIIRATSSNPTGPYQYVEEIVPFYSHNPSVARTADGEGVILVHIGNGVENGIPAQCTNGSTQSRVAHAQSIINPRSVSTPLWDKDPSFSCQLCAPSITAKFTSCNWTCCPGGLQGGFTNPTIFIEPETGDFLVGGNSNGSLGLTHGSNCSQFSCQTWGPRENVIPNRTTEDPWMWRDVNTKYWHALFHDMLPDLPAGRHAFSRDGVVWTLSSTIPYNGTVVFDDGTSITYSKRERPHLLLDPVTGVPLVLFTGVMEFPESINDRSWTLAHPIRG